jgi:hypothetical protein
MAGTLTEGLSEAKKAFPKTIAQKSKRKNDSVPMLQT